MGGNYIEYIERNDTSMSSDRLARSVDIHTLNTFHAGDGVSSYVLYHGLQALSRNERHRRLILATQEKPGDMLSYVQQEHRNFFNQLRTLRTFVNKLLPGATPEATSERTRVGDKYPKSMKSQWLGGTEYRDLGYKSYLNSKVALKSNDAITGGPIGTNLASMCRQAKMFLWVSRRSLRIWA